jgi:hypothetical protein
MTVNLSALAGAGQQFFDNNGNPLSGGKLYSYEAGTTTPQTTYTSASGATAHTNPIVLDSAGRVATGEIWLTAGQNYKFVLKTSTEVTIATWDNITGINGTGITTNANSVEYDPPFTGALTSDYTVEEKLAQYVSVADFGAVGDGVTNDTVAIQAALTASDYLEFEADKTYLVSSPLTKTGGDCYINGRGATIKAAAGYVIVPAAVNSIFKFSTLGDVDVQNLKFNGNRTVLGYPNWENFIHCISVTTADKVNVSKCEFLDFPSVGVFILYAGVASVTDSQFDNGMFHGVALNDCDQVYVGRNKINGPGDMGTNTSMGGIGILPILCENVVIEENVITNTSDTGSKTDGCNYVVYRNNIVSDSGKDGIKVMGFTTRPQCIKAVIEGNIVFNLHEWRTDGTSLILVADTKEVTVTGNVTSDSTKLTGTVNNLRVNNQFVSTIESLVVTGNSFGEISTPTDNCLINGGGLAGATIQNVVFSGNTVLSGKGVLFATLTGSLIVDGNVVDSLQASPPASPTIVGIGALGVNRSTITNNTVVNFTQGIATNFNGSPNGATADIVGNTINGTSSRGVDIANFGSTAVTVASVSVKSNTFTNVNLDDTASGVIRYRSNNLTTQVLSIVGNSVKTSTVPAWLLAFTGTVVASIDFLLVESNAHPEIAISSFPWSYATRIIGVPRASIPTDGTWARGDVVDNSSPSASGFIGWVCVTAGTPGTWKTFGAISA